MIVRTLINIVTLLDNFLSKHQILLQYLNILEILTIYYFKNILVQIQVMEVGQ